MNKRSPNKISIKARSRWKLLANFVGSEDIKDGKRISNCISRNVKQNEGLYNSDAKEGIDFVTCPILGLRKPCINSFYIRNILLMTPLCFDLKFPNFKRTCEEKIKNITESRHKINCESGLTVHQAAMAKRLITMSEVEANGLTKAQNVVQKTINTHRNKIDENGLNGFQRLVKHRNDTIIDGIRLEDIAHAKRRVTLANNYASRRFKTRASKISKLVLEPILSFLNENNIKHYFDEKEYLINYNGNLYYYDLVIPEVNLCIEFQSNVYHPNIYLTEYEWNNWKQLHKGYSAQEKSFNDIEKAKALYESRGILTWFIWENHHQQDIDISLQYIKEQLCL